VKQEPKRNLDLDDLMSSDAAEDEVGDDRTTSHGDELGEAAAAVAKAAAARSGNLGAIADIPVQLSAVLGKSAMPVSQLLRLGRGAVVELDRKVGEPIDILVNNRLVARGEVVLVEDRLGVTMTEIIKSEP
jgi:flagellar motor switch protein FliN/FliY